MLRRKRYNPAQQADRAVYPPGFEPISDVDRDDRQAVCECVQQVCLTINAMLRERAAGLSEPLNRHKAGRRKNDVAKIRDDLRVHTYILVRDMEELRMWRHVGELFERKTPGRRASSTTTRRFIDVLCYLNQVGEPNLLEREVIAEIANQLSYAHRHDVPFQFLLGFLAQVGFEEAAKKERAGEYEPWHPKHVSKSERCGRSKKSKNPKARSATKHGDVENA